MIQKVTYKENPRTADALSINAGLAAKQAIQRLSIAAACEERLNDDSHAETLFYFLVRSLCNECGHDYKEMLCHGREFAARL